MALERSGFSPVSEQTRLSYCKSVLGCTRESFGWEEGRDPLPTCLRAERQIEFMIVTSLSAANRQDVVPLPASLSASKLRCASFCGIINDRLEAVVEVGRGPERATEKACDFGRAESEEQGAVRISSRDLFPSLGGRDF